MTDPATAPRAVTPERTDSPAMWHIMAGRFVTICGVRFDPNRPVARGRTLDGKRGIDCVVCVDLYAGSYD